LLPGDVVLFKASHSMRLGDMVDEIAADVRTGMWALGVDKEGRKPDSTGEGS